MYQGIGSLWYVYELRTRMPPRRGCPESCLPEPLKWLGPGRCCPRRRQKQFGACRQPRARHPQPLRRKEEYHIETIPRHGTVFANTVGFTHQYKKHHTYHDTTFIHTNPEYHTTKPIPQKTYQYSRKYHTIGYPIPYHIP